MALQKPISDIMVASSAIYCTVYSIHEDGIHALERRKKCVNETDMLTYKYLELHKTKTGAHVQ